MFVDACWAAHQSLPERGIATVPVGWATRQARAESVAAAVLVSVAQLVGDVASKLVSASAFRDFDGSPLAQDRRRGIAHPYNDGNDSIHTVNSHNEEPNTFDLYTRRYASIIASCRHSEASQHIDRLHDDTLPHVSTKEDAVVDDAALVVGPTLDDSDLRCFRLGAEEEELGPALEQHPVAGSVEVVGNGVVLVAQVLVVAAAASPVP